MDEYNIDGEALIPIEDLPEACKQMEEALRIFQETGERNVNLIIESLAAVARSQTELWAPVLEIPTDSLDYNWETDEPQITLRTLDSSDGQVHVLFTSMEEVHSGAETEVIRVNIVEHIIAILGGESFAGLVINPFGTGAFLNRRQLQVVLDRSYPPTPDQMDLMEGANAYLRGDYATAVACYQKAAFAGNVTALSNLGYCYYYGRAMAVDKERAYQCWSKAAVFGDIPATYKMADMMINGDLSPDPVFARALYHKAYMDAREIMDPDYYPDACLRILKYCRADIDEESILLIAQDAVDGFREKVNAGETFHEKSLQEAEYILQELQLLYVDVH